MSEEKKELKTVTPSSVQQRSVVKDLAKYAMDEYIKPKTNDVLHDLFAGVVDMFGDAVRGAIDKQFYGEDRTRNRRQKQNETKVFNQGVQYNTYSLSPSNQRQVRPNNSQRSGKTLPMIRFSTKEDAEYLCNELKNDIQQYGKAKVGKVYEIVKDLGTTSPEDWKFGWADMNDISFYYEKGEYVMNFADPYYVIDK